MKKLICTILALAMIVSTMGTVVFAAGDTDIYKIGEGQMYATLEAARNAAKDDNGDGAITYEIHGKVETGYPGESIEFVPNDRTGIHTINFVGADETAELCISTKERSALDGGFNANYTINVNVTNLICSRPDGAPSDNFADGNNHFLMILSVGNTLTYTDCKFPNGVASNMKGTTIFEGCKFDNQIGNRTKQQYALWAYASIVDAAVVKVNDCSFVGNKGVKVYIDNHTAEGGADDSVTITNSDFNITGEPALVSSSYGSVVLNENDYVDNGYGIVASENGKGVITIDDENPAFVASAPDMWGTVYNVQTQKYAEELLEETKGGNPYGKVPEEKLVITHPVAMVNTTSYTSLADAFAAIKDGDTVTIYEGIYDEDFEFHEDNVTIVGQGDVTIKGHLQIGHTGTKTEVAEYFKIENINVEAESGRAVRIYGSGILTGCNFKSEEDAVSGSYAKSEGSSQVIFNNCTFDAKETALHFDGLYANTFQVNGGTVKGEVALASGTLVEFSKVNFEDGRGEADNERIQFWGDATLEDCTFAPSYIISAKSSGKLVEINNCEVSDDSDVFALLDTESKGGIVVDGNKALNRVAKIGETYYETLHDALAEAVGGDIINLLNDAVLDTSKSVTLSNQVTFELNGKTLDVNGTGNIFIKNNVTFQNGTIDITDVDHEDGLFQIYGVDGVTAEFNNITMNRKNTEANDALVYIFETEATNSTIKVVDSTLNIGGNTGWIFAMQGATNKAVVEDSEINVTAKYTSSTAGAEEEPTKVFLNGGIQVSDSEINAEDAILIKYNTSPATFTNTNVVAGNVELGNTWNIEGTSSVTVFGTVDNYKTVTTPTEVNIGEDAKLIAENITSDIVANGENVVSRADSVYVQFKKVDDDAKDKEFDKYEIILKGANNAKGAETINELASADLTFNFVLEEIEDGDMSATVLPAEGVTLSQTGKVGQEWRFMFNYDGVTKYQETDTEIVIGTVTVDGYGKYTLGVNGATTNAVYATEIVNNIVDGYTSAAELVINEDMDTTDALYGTISSEIKVPTYELTVDIDFPNMVNENEKVYQAMSVSIVGGNIDKTIDLGSDAVDTDNLYTATVEKSNVVTDAHYTIKVKLPYNTTYTVTVEGAGYRTARHSVTLTEAKTLKFWNNVMTKAEAIEAGKPEVHTNFLAGDIVKDNNINIYDLSAVVSYFGTEGLSAANHPEYAKYDLNRDGLIDSRDVAYILVSWNN